MESKGIEFAVNVKLNSKNWRNWAIDMKILLMVKKVYNHVVTAPKPSELADEAWVSADSLAALCIITNCDNASKEIAVSKENAYEMWQALKRRFQTEAGLTALRSVIGCRKGETQLMSKHVADMQTRFSALVGTPFELNEACRVGVFLASIHERYMFEPRELIWENVTAQLVTIDAKMRGTGVAALSAHSAGKGKATCVAEESGLLATKGKAAGPAFPPAKGKTTELAADSALLAAKGKAARVGPNSALLAAKGTTGARADSAFLAAKGTESGVGADSALLAAEGRASGGAADSAFLAGKGKTIAVAGDSAVLAAKGKSIGGAADSAFLAGKGKTTGVAGDSAFLAAQGKSIGVSADSAFLAAKGKGSGFGADSALLAADRRAPGGAADSAFIAGKGESSGIAGDSALLAAKGKSIGVPPDSALLAAKEKAAGARADSVLLTRRYGPCKTYQCDNCKKMGHTERACWQKRNPQRPNQLRKGAAQDMEEEGDVLLSTSSLHKF